MPSSPQSDVLKIFLYAAGSLALGAAISPWLYQFGMGIAEVTADKDTNGVIEWIGGAARRSQDNFPRYFDRALLLASLVLLAPLLAWLKLSRGGERYRDTPWSLRLPDSVISARGQPLRRNRHGWTEALAGAILAGGLLMISGWIMVKAGFFIWRDAPASTHGFANPWITAIDWPGAARKAAGTALVVSTLEEILFRGVLLGIFLRAMPATAAILLLSFFFASVHFLEPPAGMAVPDPEAANAGFVLLHQMLSRFAEPLTLIGRFSVLLAVGVVLAVARCRTASLWLPFGLHAGWIFGLTLFKAATWPVRELPETTRWLVGTSMLEGILPLMLVILTGLLVALVTRRSRHEEFDEADP